MERVGVGEGDRSVGEGKFEKPFAGEVLAGLAAVTAARLIAEIPPEGGGGSAVHDDGFEIALLHEVDLGVGDVGSGEERRQQRRGDAERCKESLFHGFIPFFGFSFILLIVIYAEICANFNVLSSILKP